MPTNQNIMSSQETIAAFYSAFQRKDYGMMQSLYHDDATFSDPVFPNLNALEVRSMWQMLLTSPTNLRIEYSVGGDAAETGSCHWEAWYQFSKTNRPVHNKIESFFEFKDGKIIRQRDEFDFWRWSRQALGLPGILLGWSPLIQNKIRSTARTRLEKFMQR